MNTQKLKLIAIAAILVIALGTGKQAHAATLTLDNTLPNTMPASSNTPLNETTITAPGTSALVTLLLENAGFRNSNEFGIYSLYTNETLSLFKGPDSPTTTTTVLFENGKVKNGSNEIDLKGTTFGLYLRVPRKNRTYYSTIDTGQFKFFEASTGAGSYGSYDRIIAMEDLPALGDEDWNDMVVGLSLTPADDAPIPEPVTIALFSIGTIVACTYKKLRRTI